MMERPAGETILDEFRRAMEWKRAAAAGAGFNARARRTFEAGESNRLTAGWLTWDAGINALLEAYLVPLRARARTWSRNTGIGRRFLSLVRDGGVGPTGYKLKMRCGDWRQEKGVWVFRLDEVANRAIETGWAAWCERGQCEVTGRLSFADVCKLQLQLTARDGEYLTKRLRGVPNRWRYQLQLLATDRIDVTHNVTPTDGRDEVRMGVHRDSAGRAKAYSLLRSAPNDFRGAGGRQVDIVPASDVFHDFLPLDVEQARGVPWSHAVLLGANMLASFEESAVYAARVGASSMGFFEQNADPAVGAVRAEDMGAAEDQATGKMIRDLEPGALELLPKGVQFKPFEGKYPSEAFDPFTKSRKRELAAGLDVAAHNLTGDMSDVNYSSARIAELAERDGWRGVAHWFVGSFVAPTFREWLELALLAGAIELPGGAKLPASRLDKYLAGVTFQGRGWDWVDPLKEVSAERIAVQEGFKTRTQVVAQKGGDFEDNVLEIEREAERLASHSVKLGAPSPAPAAPAAEPPPDDGSGDSQPGAKGEK